MAIGWDLSRIPGQCQIVCTATASGIDSPQGARDMHGMHLYTYSKEAQMQNSAITKEILALEKRYWNAMREHDLKTALALTDFPCLIAGPQGMQTVDKAQYEKMFASNEGAIRDFDFDETQAQVRQVSDDAAVIAYKVHTTFTHEGETKTMDAVDTSTWVKRGGKWACAMHTETELA
jgi:ketosteroid isomerase-like protein